MKNDYQMRQSYLSAHSIEIGKRPIYVWGYSKSGEFVCRWEINAAGIAVFAGKKGRKKLEDLSWERLVRHFEK